MKILIFALALFFPFTQGWLQTQTTRAPETVSIASAESEDQTPSTRQDRHDKDVAKHPDPNLIPYQTKESILAHFL